MKNCLGLAGEESEKGYYDVIVERIREYLGRRDITEEDMGRSLKMVFRRLISDREMEKPFKYIIREEVKKFQTEKGVSRTPQEETIFIKANIKRYLIRLIKEQCENQKMKRGSLGSHQQLREISSQMGNDMDSMGGSLKSFFNESESLNTPLKKKKILKKENARNIATCFKGRLLQNIKPIISSSLRGNAKEIFINNDRKQTSQDNCSRTQIKQSHPKNLCDPEDYVNLISQEQPRQQCSAPSYQIKTRSNILEKYLSFLPQYQEEECSEKTKTERMGHFVYGDRIKRIIDVRMTGVREREQTLLIEWYARKSGFKPQNSVLGFSDFSYYKPLQAKMMLKRRDLDAN